MDTQADSEDTGRVTVPVLYDTETDTVVNNESADIARMLDGAFDRHATREIDLYPANRRDEYHAHFTCNVRRLVDYENPWPYAREIYQLPGVRETCNIDHVKAHYYRSHEGINPTGVVPVGPATDWSASHDRARLDGSTASPIPTDQ